MLALKERPKSQLRLVNINDNELLNYLKNFDIARDLFDKSVVKSNNDRALIKRYYDSKRENADRLVIEDEFVGITYKNLDTIDNLLEENKLVKIR